ncbi:MAG: S41 family peptidase [Bacteroidales bacterium]|nr:S41 family peptidase [Bacteroidales bacterium]
MRKTVFIPFLGSILFAFGLWLGYTLHRTSSNESNTSQIEQTIKLITENYVDSVSDSILKQYAIEGMLEKLDPHSSYISAEQFKKINEDIEGSFEGIGIQFRIQDDTIFVIDVIPNGPSEKAGLRRGDRIIEVDGKKVAGINITNEQVLKMLKGPKGTQVQVKVYRKNQRKNITYTITRNVIPLHSVDASFMLNATTGYIKLTTFNANAAEETEKAIQILKKQGMQQLILDLRNNGGGLLHVAIEIADMLLPIGKTIVYTKGLNRKEIFEKSTNYDVFAHEKLVVLINEFSASASEIVAGAIQDNDRGWIVGRRSFGKGLVQEQFKLKDGSAIRLTVARYYTPSGRCIQRPYNQNTEDYYLDFYKQISADDSLLFKYNTYPQDSTPYFTVSGRKVYGGGGIYPDYVILHDFNIQPELFETFFDQAFFSHLYTFIENNRSTFLRSYPNEKDFLQHFNPNDLWLKNTFTDTSFYKKLLHLNPKEREEVGFFFKAYMAREIYGNESFFKVISTIDQSIQKALEILKRN